MNVQLELDYIQRDRLAGHRYCLFRPAEYGGRFGDDSIRHIDERIQLAIQLRNEGWPVALCPAGVVVALQSRVEA